MEGGGQGRQGREGRQGRQGGEQKKNDWVLSIKEGVGRVKKKRTEGQCREIKKRRD